MQFRLMVTVAVAAVILAGCRTDGIKPELTVQDVASSLSQKYVGKNIDALVTDLGPPSSSFKMNSGNAYVWNLSSSVDYSFGKYGGTAEAHDCKINAIASQDGIVTKLTTQDEDGPPGLVGNLESSLCAKRLGMAPKRLFR